MFNLKSPYPNDDLTYATHSVEIRRSKINIKKKKKIATKNS